MIRSLLLALLALRAYTTVLTYRSPTALLAPVALTTVRTSTAHLALRAVLHPVLARPLCWRGSLPLHALVHLLRDFHFDIGIVAVRNLPPDVRSPNRRHHSRAPNEVPPANILRSHRSSQNMISVPSAGRDLSPTRARRRRWRARGATSRTTTTTMRKSSGPRCARATWPA